MVSLDASRYEEGEIMVHKGEYMRDIIFIMKGSCDIYGTYQQLERELLRFKVVKLGEGSWFGDY